MGTQRKKETRMRLRFLRSVKLPRFKMNKGEIWVCYKEWGTGLEYTNAIATGDDRFDFGGGSCLIKDVEVVKG